MMNVAVVAVFVVVPFALIMAAAVLAVLLAFRR